MSILRVAKDAVKFVAAGLLALTVGPLPESGAGQKPSYVDAAVRWLNRSPWGQALVVFFAFGFVGVLLVIGYLMFSNPRMRTQPNIRSYQAVMPLAPPNAVPLVDPVPKLPTTRAAAELHNPLTPTPANMARGRVYYEYYCLYCHGEDGKTVGPVGESYVPAPSNLRTQKIQKYSDGKLLHAMLAGRGHEPVLPRVVLPEHRWFLVLYLRHWPTTQPGRSP